MCPGNTAPLRGLKTRIETTKIGPPRYVSYQSCSRITRRSSLNLRQNSFQSSRESRARAVKCERLRRDIFSIMRVPNIAGNKYYSTCIDTHRYPASNRLLTHSNPFTQNKQNRHCRRGWHFCTPRCALGLSPKPLSGKNRSGRICL